MNGYDSYLTYISLKAHFKNPSFDFFKYGRLKASRRSYELRNDHPFFEKLSRKYSDDIELVEYLVSQIKDNPDVWVGAIFDDEAQDRHMRRIKSVQSMGHNLESSTRTLAEQHNSRESFGSLFVVPKDGRHPKFLSMLLQRKITEETFLCYNDLTKFMERWDERMKNDPIWEDMSFRLKRYSPFLKIDSDKIKQEIVSTLDKTLLTS
jgi:hypothetical protein